MMSLAVSAQLLLASSLLPIVTCGSGEDIDRILQDTVTLNPKVRPVKNLSTTTVVEVSFHLISIAAFDTVEQSLVSNGYLSVRWDNEYFNWLPWNYGNIHLVSPDPDKIWRPTLTVMNTMKELKPIGENYVLLAAMYNGTMFWFPADRFETFCRVDVTYFPFDIQTCQWTFFIWSTDSISEITMKPSRPDIVLDSFVPNGEWELLATRAWRGFFVEYGIEVVRVFYEVTLRRRPSLLVLTVLLPMFILAVVNVFVFAVPSESGERLSYSITSLLSLGVFLSFIMDSMPSSTETLSIMAVNLSCQLVLSAVYVLLCILSLRLFHLDPVMHPVSSTVQSLIVGLEILICLDHPAKHKVDDVGVTVTDVTPSDVSGIHNDVRMTNGGLHGKLDKMAVTKNVKRAAYNDHEEMTWQRVSRTLDKLFFRFFLCLVLVSNVAVWGVMLNNYLNV